MDSHLISALNKPDLLIFTQRKLSQRLFLTALPLFHHIFPIVILSRQCLHAIHNSAPAVLSMLIPMEYCTIRKYSSHKNKIHGSVYLYICKIYGSHFFRRNLKKHLALLHNLCYNFLCFYAINLVI